MTVQQAIAGFLKTCGEDGLTAELGIVHCEGGQRKMLIPVAVAMVPIGDSFALALVTEEEIERLTKQNGRPPAIGERTTA